MRKGAAEVAMGLVVRGIEACSNLGFGDETKCVMIWLRLFGRK